MCNSISSGNPGKQEKLGQISILGRNVNKLASQQEIWFVHLQLTKSLLYQGPKGED